jgi:putative ABC transport system permease protein
VAVAVLALRIGATSAIFSLASAVWLKPLPFADEDRLVTLWGDFTPIGGPPRVELSPANYVDWQQRAQSFESMAPIERASFNLTGDGGEPERLAGARTTSSLFATIGLAPLVGRTFVPEDGTGEPVAVVSEGFWLRRLGGDPAAVGRTITLDGSPHLVVGVVPRDFRFPGESDVFVPTVWAPEVLEQENSYFWYLVAKLKPGVTLDAARAEMRLVSEALRAESPSRGLAVTIVPLRESLTRGAGFAADVGPTILALQKEFAIRKALGAARGRVVRQLLTESILLAVASVVIGLGIAAACFGYLSRLLPGTLPASAELALDWRVLALTTGAALVPALRAASVNPMTALRAEGQR